MVGENLRDGGMEVAFELWIEQIGIGILLDSNGISTVIMENNIGAYYNLPVL